MDSLYGQYEQNVAYYNEHDPKAAAWLRELVKRGLIADGKVDERSILEVQPDDLKGFTQCHFFAGIGGWPYALQLAGWPGAEPVWTGSPPCQPFSAAGKRLGTCDERYLWPVYFRLIAQCRPATLFGEQVAAAVAQGWLDTVFDDLEREGYACGAVTLPACSVGAPHIRQRLWFVADATEPRWNMWRGASETGVDFGQKQRLERLCDVSSVADADGEGLEGRVVEPERPRLPSGERGGAAWDAEWINCTDGKARPVEPGTFPLAHGIPARVGRLRGYGNAIVPQVAAEVIGAFMDIREDNA